VCSKSWDELHLYIDVCLVTFKYPVLRVRDKQLRTQKKKHETIDIHQFH